MGASTRASFDKLRHEDLHAGFLRDEGGNNLQHQGRGLLASEFEAASSSPRGTVAQKHHGLSCTAQARCVSQMPLIEF